MNAMPGVCKNYVARAATESGATAAGTLLDQMSFVVKPGKYAAQSTFP